MITMDIRHFPPLEYQQAEAMNTLCTNLSLTGGDIRKILITSCRPQEGKSFVAMNLMRAMAALGLKVILVDADIRASILQRTYSIDVHSGSHYIGLCGYLSGLCSIEDVIAKTNIDGADMILSGRTVMNSFPLLNSPRLATLLNHLASAYDLVLVDAPPVGTIIDAAKIATQCDRTLFVVESGGITASELKSSSYQIEKMGCPILGYVLNKIDTRNYKKKYYSSYYYSSEHRSEQSGVSRRGRKQRKSKEA